MTYAVIGTGAIGGYYGGRLAKAGFDVHFLAHSDYDEMRQALVVDSCNGSFSIQTPKVYRSTEAMPQVDVVIVALKTTNNHLLPALLKPLLGPDTVVVLIQNGLCVEQDLANEIAGIRLIAGLAFICSTKTGPAHINHQDYGSLTLAPYNPSCQQKAQQIASDFKQAGVETSITEYHFGRWRKAIWNLPFNGLSVVCQADTLQLLEQKESLVHSIMEEVLEIARAIGVDSLSTEHIDRNIQDTRTMKPYSPSMKVDYENHRPMEIYYLYTRALIEAERLGLNCPHLKELEQQLLSLDTKSAS